MSEERPVTASGGFFQELKRRKVIASAGWYLGVAFVVMQVVEVVIPYARVPEQAGTVVLVALVAGFPVALTLSWFFDIRPPRFQREAFEGDARRAAVRREAEGGGTREIRSDAVAILPFENLSADPENAYFSDGITDDIIAAVARVQGLRVLSRASSMRYRDLAQPMSKVGAELGVATVVVGSVRRSGPRVRVVARVVDARSDDHLWTETYDRDLEDIFEVQSDIAARIAKAVEREISPSDLHSIRERGTDDAEAYDLYLRGRFLWNERSEVSVSRSIRYFERALERDGSFALAHAALADAYTVLGIYGMRDPRAVLEAAKRSAHVALELDARLGEAVASEACVRCVYDWAWTEAERAFERAIELSPSYATAYQWYASNLLVPLGRFEEARVQLARAEEVDPVSGAISVSQGIASFYEGAYDEAERRLERVVALHPRFALAHLFLAQCHEVAGDPARAMEAAAVAVELSGSSSEAIATLARAYAAAGATAESEALLERLEERAEHSYVSPSLRAQVLLGLGRSEEALARLEEAADGRASDLVWLAVRPAYEPLRSHPRFAALLERVGIA